VNQILKEAGAAKASFYQHFPSKEDLCVEYLEKRHLISHSRQKNRLNEGDTPYESICRLFDIISDLSQKSDYNGCHFLNISAEIHESDSRIREVVARHKSKLISIIEERLADYADSRFLAESVYLLYEGAIMAVRNFRDVKHVDTAKKTIAAMLERNR
jgi:AcrR family transcriptional regulator